MAQITGYTRIWIYQLVKRYNQLRTSALGDQRHHNPRKEANLTDIQQAQLWQILEDKAPDGGLWNGRKVADWLTGLKFSNESNNPIKRYLAEGMTEKL